MRNFMRLLSLFRAQAIWLLLGLSLALLALLSQLLLMSSAGQSLLLGGALLWWLRASGLARPLLRYIERLATHTATFRVLARLRLWVFGRLVPLAPAQLGYQRAGDVLSRLLNDIEALDGFYLRLLLPLTLAALGAGLGLFLLWPIAPHTTLYIGLILIGFMGLSALYLRRLSPALELLPAQLGELRSHTLDGCEGLADLLAAEAAYTQLHRLSASSAQLNRLQLHALRLRAGLQALTSLTGLLILILLLATLPQALGAHQILLILLLAVALLELMPGCTQALLSLPGLRAASTRIFALSDTQPQFAEPANSAALSDDLTIRFGNVQFGYDAARPVLTGINLTLAPGDHVVICGPSGAGKSSLINLLLKFWQPQAGHIQVGNTDLQNIEGDLWRSRLGYLSQKTALLAGTVRDNLQLARPQADDTQMWQALQDAGLDSFIRTLPDGLDSWVGDSGTQFSGGQARRLALAQIILRDAPIWLLDEPTEGLDAATAAQVMQTLARRAHGKTVLLITHQPAQAALFAGSSIYKLTEGQLDSDG